MNSRGRVFDYEMAWKIGHFMMIKYLIGGKFGDFPVGVSPVPGLPAGFRVFRSVCLGVEESRVWANPGPLLVLRLPDPVRVGK